MLPKSPIFEIRTVEVVNRGIALIPIAIKQRLQKEFPGAKFAIPPYCYQTEGIAYAVDNCFYPLIWNMQMWEWQFKNPYKRLTGTLRNHLRQFGYVAEMIPQAWCNKFGLIKESTVDVVLETKGFIFSDQWGISPVREVNLNMRRWKKQGKKIILLPQAFGPFENKTIRKEMKAILDGSDLIFAREKTSFDYLKDISPDNTRIRQAPDFTNLLEGIAPENPGYYKDKIAIIPNARMLDKTGPKGAQAYRHFLQQALKTFRDHNQPFCMLLHEGRQIDYNLAQDAVASLQGKIEIISEPNPLKIKGIIGCCKAVVSARYHGLINALSQNVPAIAIGWSHKYEELMTDYQIPEAFIPLNCSPDDIATKLNLLLDPQILQNWNQKISTAAREEKAKAEQMWQDVFACIQQ